ncbi:glycosyltransferase [Oceanobacter mangrovi]|uniref:glycosyltransferase n=1 Tax=Oceanobacter mangrovi TaxID=2862510 RepID=UPI001C8EFD36|nr:glycosyltransferase [Oceanobacter mangrovi]
MNTAVPMRVGILIATLEVGGAERMALAVARALLDAGLDVRFYCMDPGGQMPLPGTPEQQRQLAERIVVLGDGKSGSTLKKALAFPRMHRRFCRHVEDDQLNLVISFMERANILNLLGSRKVPRIISIRKHLSMALADKDPLKRWLVKRGYALLLGRASNINLNSSEAAEDLLQWFPVVKPKLSVINNFFEPLMLQKGKDPLTTEEQQLLEGTSILSCGRLAAVKRQDALIRAFADVATRHPDARLIIVGDGPKRAELQQLVDQLGLQQRVHLVGFKANPYAWISRCKLFVLSSRAEGFPNALLEAMALGRPVIAADCRSGPRELLAPETQASVKTTAVDMASFGVLTAPLEGPLTTALVMSDSEKSLADAIERMLNNNTLCETYQQKSLQRAADFSRDVILGQWLVLANKVVASSLH